MNSYYLRPTSLIGAKLDAELRFYGAHTSGTTQRKQERLQRFMNVAEKKEKAREILRVVIENEQRNVYERAKYRSMELRSRRKSCY